MGLSLPYHHLDGPKCGTAWVWRVCSSSTNVTNHPVAPNLWRPPEVFGVGDANLHTLPFHILLYTYHHTVIPIVKNTYQKNGSPVPTHQKCLFRLSPGGPESGLIRCLRSPRCTGLVITSSLSPASFRRSRGTRRRTWTDP